ncbi:MAG: replication-relaxation family protein [Planctomycetota bacterium]
MRVLEREICVLTQLAKHLVLTRPHISRLCYPTDKNGRVTRARLRALHACGFVNRKPFRASAALGPPTFLYLLTREGCKFLSDHFDNIRYRFKPTSLVQPSHVDHYLEMSDLSILFQNDVVPEQTNVQLINWYNDSEVINFDEVDEELHFRLFTEIQQSPRRIICRPDAGFLLEKDGVRGVFYVERERDRTGPRQVAAKKVPGYLGLLEQQLHKRHFPTSSLERFTVLFVGENGNHRDRLKVAFAKHADPGRWRFASVRDLNSNSFLFEPVWYRCDIDEPTTLVK